PRARLGSCALCARARTLGVRRLRHRPLPLDEQRAVLRSQLAERDERRPRVQIARGARRPHAREHRRVALELLGARLAGEEAPDTGGGLGAATGGVVAAAARMRVEVEEALRLSLQ